jgi:hypothetical protein
MLMGESTPGSMSLLGLGMLGVAIVSALTAKYWYTYLETHPPREGTLAYKQWNSVRRLFPYYRLLSTLAAICCAIGGVSVLVFAFYRALST